MVASFFSFSVELAVCRAGHNCAPWAQTVCGSEWVWNLAVKEALVDQADDFTGAPIPFLNRVVKGYGEIRNTTALLDKGV